MFAELKLMGRDRSNSASQAVVPPCPATVYGSPLSTGKTEDQGPALGALDTPDSADPGAKRVGEESPTSHYLL